MKTSITPLVTSQVDLTRSLSLPFRVILVVRIFIHGRVRIRMVMVMMVVMVMVMIEIDRPAVSVHLVEQGGPPGGVVL